MTLGAIRGSETVELRHRSTDQPARKPICPSYRTIQTRISFTEARRKASFAITKDALRRRRRTIQTTHRRLVRICTNTSYAEQAT